MLIDSAFNKGKKDGFYGNRSVVLSKKLLRYIRANPLINGLYVAAIGHYPHAVRHYRRREQGVDENILIYCIGGSGIIEVNGQSYYIEPNTLFVIPARVPHAYWASDSDPWSIYWLHFCGKNAHYLKKYFRQIITIDEGPDARINERINLFNEILTTMELGFSKDNIEFANLSLNGLLASFFYVHTYISSKGFQSNNPVDQAIFFMQKHLEQCLSLQDIADHVQLSKSHLSKIFRNKTGTSPIDYFINLKMQEAIRILISESLQIQEVAFKLGYDDAYYFSRLFKKNIGRSPGSFVKASKITTK